MKTKTLMLFMTLFSGKLLCMDSHRGKADSIAIPQQMDPLPDSGVVGIPGDMHKPLVFVRLANGSTVIPPKTVLEGALSWYPIFIREETTLRDLVATIHRLKTYRYNPHGHGALLASEVCSRSADLLTDFVLDASEWDDSRYRFVAMDRKDLDRFAPWVVHQGADFVVWVVDRAGVHSEAPADQQMPSNSSFQFELVRMYIAPQAR